MENRVKILIADGNDEFCSHLKKLLEETSGYDVVGIAADGEQALAMLTAHQPDVLVLDLLLSKADGIAILKQAHAMPKPPVALVLSGFMTEYVGNMAISLGVQYFMTKPCDFEHVAERITRSSPSNVSPDLPRAVARSTSRPWSPRSSTRSAFRHTSRTISICARRS